MDSVMLPSTISNQYLIYWPLETDAGTVEPTYNTSYKKYIGHNQEQPWHRTISCVS